MSQSTSSNFWESPLVMVNESTAHVTGLLAGLGVGQTFKYIAEPHFQDRHAVAPVEELEASASSDTRHVSP